MTNLEPCRHCGHTETKTLSDGCASYHVMCMGCMAFGPLAPFEAAAEEAWNRRVERTCKRIFVRVGHHDKCSECRHIFFSPLEGNYCPGCGALIIREEGAAC